MASTGLEAWKRHFAGKGDIDVALKKATKLKLPNGKDSSVIVPIKGIVTLKGLKNEKEYLSYSSGMGRNPTAWLPVKYEKKDYLCTIDSFAKPGAGGKADYGLQTGKVLGAATPVIMDLYNKKDVTCAVFKSADEIVNIATRYIKKNNLITNAVFKKSLMKYLESGEYDRIEWSGNVSDNEIAEFKYIGELSIALAIMSGKNRVISGTNPFVGKKVKRVIYPLSESFRGVDCIMELTDGSKIPISSKSAKGDEGKGAAASFWENVYPEIINDPKNRPKNSIFDKIYTSAMAIGDAGGKKPKSIHIVYEYGIRHILKLGKSVIADTSKVYEEFAKYDKLTDYSTDVRKVYMALKEKMTILKDETALKNLDASTTVFFAGQINMDLNEDEKMKKIIKRILANKDYYQMTLNLSELRKGNFKFRGVHSGEGEIEFQKARSAYNDITAKHGTINFYIIPPK